MDYNNQVPEDLSREERGGLQLNEDSIVVAFLVVAQQWRNDTLAQCKLGLIELKPSSELTEPYRTNP